MARFNATFRTREAMKVSFGTVIEVSDSEAYTGDYVITPSEETQVLATKNRLCVENIVVGPIPQNYGRISYNGYSLTVS